MLRLLCLWGFINHDLQRQRMFHPGRRGQSLSRQADPPGWGYLTTWIECTRCGYRKTLSIKECWETDVK